jgi:hypothetical protein
VPTRPSSPPVAIRASTHWISTDSRKKPVAKMPLPKVSLASAPFLDVVARFYEGGDAGGEDVQRDGLE